jgi:hypothetical protein
LIPQALDHASGCHRRAPAHVLWPCAGCHWWLAHQCGAAPCTTVLMDGPSDLHVFSVASESRSLAGGAGGGLTLEVTSKAGRASPDIPRPSATFRRADANMCTYVSGARVASEVVSCMLRSLHRPVSVISG